MARKNRKTLRRSGRTSNYAPYDDIGQFVVVHVFDSHDNRFPGVLPELPMLPELPDYGPNNGFMYSMFHKGRPEFIATNVPKSQAPIMHSVINFLASQIRSGIPVMHGHTGEHPDGLHFIVKELKGEEKEAIIRQHGFAAQLFTAPLLQLLPRFVVAEGDPELPNVDWGFRRPPAVDGNEKMVDDILSTWRDQWMEARTFYRNRKMQDPNGKVFSMAKFYKIDLTDALRHVDDWDCDWEDNLTFRQIKYVKQHAGYFRMITRVLFRKIQRCAICGKLEGLSKCGKCKQAWYCCRDHQIEDWKNHKKECVSTEVQDGTSTFLDNKMQECMEVLFGVKVLDDNGPSKQKSNVDEKLHKTLEALFEEKLRK